MKTKNDNYVKQAIFFYLRFVFILFAVGAGGYLLTESDLLKTKSSHAMDNRSSDYLSSSQVELLTLAESASEHAEEARYFASWENRVIKNKNKSQGVYSISNVNRTIEQVQSLIERKQFTRARSLLDTAIAQTERAQDVVLDIGFYHRVHQSLEDLEYTLIELRSVI